LQNRNSQDEILKKLSWLHIMDYKYDTDTQAELISTILVIKQNIRSEIGMNTFSNGRERTTGQQNVGRPKARWIDDLS
jgi:hypothetical protein